MSRTKTQRHKEILFFILDSHPETLEGRWAQRVSNFIRFSNNILDNLDTIVQNRSGVALSLRERNLSHPRPTRTALHQTPFWTPVKLILDSPCAEPFFHHEEHEVNEEGHSSQRIASSGAVIRWLQVFILCPFECFVDNNVFHFQLSIFHFKLSIPILDTCYPHFRHLSCMGCLLPLGGLRSVATVFRSRLWRSITLPNSHSGHQFCIFWTPSELFIFLVFRFSQTLAL